MPDPNLPLLKDAAGKLAPFLDEIVFVGGITQAGYAGRQSTGSPSHLLACYSNLQAQRASKRS